MANYAWEHGGADKIMVVAPTGIDPNVKISQILNHVEELELGKMKLFFPAPSFIHELRIWAAYLGMKRAIERLETQISLADGYFRWPVGCLTISETAPNKFSIILVHCLDGVMEMKQLVGGSSDSSGLSIIFANGIIFEFRRYETHNFVKLGFMIPSGPGGSHGLTEIAIDAHFEKFASPFSIRDL